MIALNRIIIKLTSIHCKKLPYIIYCITTVVHYKKEVKAILNPDSTKPLYRQIAEWIETEILNGHLKEDQKVYSQYQLADMFTINPATAAKGINLLVEEQILYKKRGLGMFVENGSKEMILNKRKNQTLQIMVAELILEAKRLNISKKELIRLIDEVNIEEGEDENN
jgi:GntR family transcriptional regulator